MKTTHYIITILLFMTSVLGVKGQTYPVGHMSINFKDITRSGGYSISGGISTSTATGRDIGTEVYYPATIAGNNQPVASGQFPVIAFGHGFVMSWDSYDNIYNLLASKGYIVLLPRTEGGFSPTHAEFGSDLKYLANAGMTLNSISSPTVLTIFNGKVAQKSAIGGHSMGAGSSYLAAANNNSITCLFNFAAATTNPSSINSASLISVPALVISGARDCVADTTVQNSHYNALGSSKKYHVILKQLTHCDFGNGTNTNCTLGQGSSGCGNQVSNSLAFSRYMGYLEPFLNNLLKNDCPEGQRFMDSVNAASSIRAGLKKQGSIACISTSLEETKEALFSISPNPVEDWLQITLTKQFDSDVKVEIINLTGQVLYNSFINNTHSSLDLSNYSKGLYFIRLSTQKNQHTLKFIKN